jgi:hypothetical protein
MVVRQMELAIENHKTRSTSYPRSKVKLYINPSDFNHYTRYTGIQHRGPGRNDQNVTLYEYEIEMDEMVEAKNPVVLPEQIIDLRPEDQFSDSPLRTHIVQAMEPPTVSKLVGEVSRCGFKTQVGYEVLSKSVEIYDEVIDEYDLPTPLLSDQTYDPGSQIMVVPIRSTIPDQLIGDLHNADAKRRLSTMAEAAIGTEVTNPLRQTVVVDDESDDEGEDTDGDGDEQKTREQVQYGETTHRLGRMFLYPTKQLREQPKRVRTLSSVAYDVERGGYQWVN